MSNFNKVFLMGRLTRDPELRYTPQGTAVSDIGLAVNREYTHQSGERKKETVFVDVTLWKKQAEICCQYLRKGSPIFIEGRLSMDSWEGQDGQKRTKMRVVAENFQFIGGGRGSGGDAPVPDAENGSADGPPPPASPSESRRGGDYGANYRRPKLVEPVPGASSPGGDEDEPPKEDDIPF
jgi:single-strand DNA-binding protein